MTRHASHLPRERRRDLERRLAEIPTPPPPTGLLDAIRAEIPAEISAANRPAPARKPWHRRPSIRLAASLAVVAVGLTIATRVIERNDRSPALVVTETRPAHDEDRYRSDVRMTPSLALRRTPEAPNQPLPETLPEGRLIPRRDRARGETAPLKELNESESAATRYQAAPRPQAPSPSLDASGSTGQKAAALGESKELELYRSKLGANDKQERRAEPGRQGDKRAESDTVTDTLFDIPESAATPTESSPLAKQVPAPQVQELRALGYVAGEESVAQEENARRIVAAPPSTGGTAEPLDRSAGDMFFRPVGTNPFVDSAEDRLSTFALDVDTGSWTLARNYLERGALPPAEAIRVEEFVNAQRYDDPSPRRGDFTLVAEGAPSPFAPRGEYRLLRFAVQARTIAESRRRPANLTFVVDVSGSMNRENRLGLVKRALGLLLDELRPDDRVALVVFGTRGRVLLEPTRDHEAIRDAIAWLRPEGSTNAEEGLRLGYDLADRVYRADATNRLVLCSDGVANVGATGPESILARIGSEARRGIELTTVGFGMGNYNDALMEQLADQGDGSYHYVDTLDEARRVFVDDLTGTLETVARDAKVQVEFDPEVVDRWRLVGYENRDVADRDFRNDAVDAGELGSGHAATALYEVRLASGARRGDRLATLRLRWKSTATGQVDEAALDLHVHDLARSFDGARLDVRKAAVAAELAELLKRSDSAREGSWDALVAAADRLRRDARRDASAAELASLVERAASLSAPLRRPMQSFDEQNER